MKIHSFMITSLLLCATSQVKASPPLTISPAILREGTAGTCPTSHSLDFIRTKLKDKIVATLQNVASPTGNAAYNCPCGGPGLWTPIADFNFSDPDVSCPSNLHLITSPVRGCGRSSGAAGICNVVMFPTNSRFYSRVCGRVLAYQKGEPNAFKNSFDGVGLEGSYVDGVSLTHGQTGFRKHIWTFAAAKYENGSDQSFSRRSICKCTNTEHHWPYSLPELVDNNSYFCATGNPGPRVNHSAVYTADPLWDGEGCGPTNACCQLNNPPWFCTQLAQPTEDNVELRMCLNGSEDDEDLILSVVNIYIM